MPKYSVAQRVDAIRSAMSSGATLETLCRLMEADKADLREFIRLNVGYLLPEFDELVQRAAAPARKAMARARSFKGRPTSGADRADYGNEVVGLAGKAQLLHDFITGQVHFSEDERPFNRLTDDEQDIVRRQAADFMFIHERESRRVIVEPQ